MPHVTVIFLTTPNTFGTLAPLIERFNVTAVNYEGRGPVVWGRFAEYLRVLAQHADGDVLHVDARDTVFQADVFAAVRTKTRADLVVFQESAAYTIGTQWHNRRWVFGCGMTNRSILHRIPLCAGTIYGSAEGFGNTCAHCSSRRATAGRRALTRAHITSSSMRARWARRSWRRRLDRCAPLASQRTLPWTPTAWCSTSAGRAARWCTSLTAGPTWRRALTRNLVCSFNSPRV